MDDDNEAFEEENDKQVAAEEESDPEDGHIALKMTRMTGKTMNFLSRLATKNPRI